MPISLVGFLSELLGEPCRDQRHSAGRPVPGSGVHLFQQPMVKPERDLHPVAPLILSASTRSAIACRYANAPGLSRTRSQRSGRRIGRRIGVLSDAEALWLNRVLVQLLGMA
jgi:hypothetical protein